MADRVTGVRRISREELAGTAYKQLAQALFGEATWDNHVRYCRWLFQDNPATLPSEPLPIYVFEEEGVLVGQAGFIPNHISLHGTRLRAGWCVDYYILPTHQRRGIGEKLLSAAAADFPVLMALGGTDPSFRRFVKSGWHAAGNLVICTAALLPVRYAARRLAEKARLQRVLGPVLRPASTHGAPRLTGIQVKPVTELPDEGDQIPSLQWSGDRSSGMCRSAAFFRWRYLQNPFVSYFVHHLKIASDVQARAVWRVSDEGGWRRGVIVDLVFPAGLAPPLVRRIIGAVQELMRSEGVEIFECQTSDPDVLGAIPQARFSGRQTGRWFVYGRMDGQSFPHLDVRDWRIYAGDCDLDIFAARNAVVS